MDKVSTLGDAINYIVELKGEVKKLEAELREAEKEDHSRNSDAVQILEHKDCGNLAATHENDQSSCSHGERNPIQVQ